MRYGAKGVFKMETTFVDANRPKNVFYEIRIINLDAADDEEAARKASELFSQDTWYALAPSPEIALQDQSFAGLSQVKELQSMDGHEVWYEYVDDRPALLSDPKPGA